MFRTPGFHHVTLVSGNTPRTIRFYQDLLGLPSSRIPAEKCSPSAPTLRFGGEGRPGPLLTFLERPGADRGRPGIGGVHHVALGVPDEAALLKWKRWLNDRGVATSGPIDRGYFRSLYFTDPDGQILELATSGPGYAIDEPEGALGQAVIEHHEHLLQRSEGVPYSHRTHPEPVGEISPEMALTGIHHVSAITSDTERADRFYSRALGLTRVKKTVNQDDRRMPHHFWASYDGRKVAPHSSWTLFGYPSRWHPALEGVGQTQRVAFRAVDAEALGAQREAMLSAGVSVGPVIERGATRSVYFTDPEGMGLELTVNGQR